MQRALYILLGIVLVAIVVGGVWYEVSINQPSPIQGVPRDNTPYSGPSNTVDVTNGGSAQNGGTGTTQAGGTQAGSASSSTQAYMAIPIQGGRTMVVKDFIDNGETAADRVNPGYYYLAGSIGYCLGDGTCPSGYKTDDFKITYHTSDGLFNIVLLKEPLAQMREEAGLFIRDRLGISAAQACMLNYFISTPDAVSPIYSGKNLGFSFCPGATAL